MNRCRPIAPSGVNILYYNRVKPSALNLTAQQRGNEQKFI